jgi:hypothetical protein
VRRMSSFTPPEIANEICWMHLTAQRMLDRLTGEVELCPDRGYGGWPADGSLPTSASWLSFPGAMTDGTEPYSRTETVAEHWARTKVSLTRIA